jgi:hypothetical protein
MDEENLKLYPAWKQAVRDFLQDFKYGDIVSHDWLSDHFGIPQQNVAMSAAEFKARQFEWLASIEGFKDQLLRDHQVLLQSIRGEGYRWCEPGDQTRVATVEFERDMRRNFRTTAVRLKNVRIQELTADQKQENIDAVAKLSALQGAVKKQIGR